MNNLSCPDLKTKEFFLLGSFARFWLRLILLYRSAFFQFDSSHYTGRTPSENIQDETTSSSTLKPCQESETEHHTDEETKKKKEGSNADDKPVT